MFNLVFYITITQIPSALFPKRNKVINMDFCESYRWDSSWKNMTDTGTLIIPKNLFYTDANKTIHPLDGDKINAGGFNSEPLFMRGDRIVLRSGYKYFNSSNIQIEETAEIINGFISKVHSSIPIQFEIEDNMYLLKQTSLTNRTFSKNDTLEDILKFVIDHVNKQHNTKLTVSALTKTNFGAFMVEKETAAQLLNRLQRIYGFTSYFRGDQLRCGTIVYNENDAQTQLFIMNGVKGNVCAENQNLEYQRKDDIILSAVAHNTITEETGANCKDGSAKTKKTRLEVLVTFKNGSITKKSIAQGEHVPTNEEGERMEFFFPGETTIEGLAQRAEDKLKQYYYDGLKGSFQVWGIPYVKHGDWVKLENPMQPEQDGTYKVRGVIYEGGANQGLRQTIFLDFKQTV